MMSFAILVEPHSRLLLVTFGALLEIRKKSVLKIKVDITFFP